MTSNMNTNITNLEKIDSKQNSISNIPNIIDNIFENKNIDNKYKKNNNNTINNTNIVNIKQINKNIDININLRTVPENQVAECIYIGKIVNGKRNGKGKLIFPDKSEYEGNFKNNYFDGYGKYKCKSYIYEGNFVEGKMSGKGKYEDFLKETIYEGDFLDDKKNGIGTEKYANDSIYKGEFKNGMKEGKGNLIFRNYKNKGKDLIYTGEFKNNNICGIGEMKISDKKDYYGEWLNNEMNGYGIAHDGNLRHFGYFVHGIKEGFGASFYEDQGFVFLGKWEEDLVSGPSILMSLDVENNNVDSIIEKQNIVGMYRGEIIDIKLGEKDINVFKHSEEYHEMINLFKNKFYPDFLKYFNNKRKKSDN